MAAASWPTPSSTRELAQRLQKKGAATVYVNSFFPGNIPTEAMSTWEQPFGRVTGTLFKGMFQVIGQSPTGAAATALFFAASKDVETRDLKGRYFVPIPAEHKASPLADDRPDQKPVVLA